MNAAGDILLGIFRQAWALIAGLLVLIAVLGGLAQVFKTTGGVLLGSNVWVSQGVANFLGVILVGLVGFLSIPTISQAATISGVTTGCGPIAEIGQLAGMLIGGIGALRMLKGTFAAVVSASIGGSGGVSTALIEIAETIFGMLCITVAAPVTAAFFGAC
ncbi:MAG TPA: hypothetical protein VHP14_15650 [Anaerolineales bacterium]|nr:hypothetical protein [Anaerolineales bacterium]